MSHYRLEVMLHQYTPLLHFQGNEEGACLRASEVKPKLDRFVLEYLKRQGIPETEIPREWKLAVSHDEEGTKHPPALRYKMRFEAVGDAQKSWNYKNRDDQRNNQKGIHPLYFGMGEENFTEDGKSKIIGIYYPWVESGMQTKNYIRMTILCMAQEQLCLKDGTQATLLNLVKNLLPAFFALHCFGTRSNKGFGSFGVAEIDGKDTALPAPKDLIAYLPESVPALYYAQYNEHQLISGSLTPTQYLNDIQALSAIMKGGMNFTHGNPNDPGYFKGAIFKFFQKDTKLHSEKALIKRNILPCPAEDEVVCRKYGKQALPADAAFLYMRSVLGVGQNFEYKQDKRNPDSMRRGKVTIKGKEKGPNGKPVIARFENPVHFKPYGEYLLLLPQPIPSKMLGTEGTKFILEAGGRSDVISGPTVNQFNLDQFMQFFAEIYVSDPELKGFARRQKPVKIFADVLSNIHKIERVEAAKGGI